MRSSLPAALRAAVALLLIGSVLAPTPNTTVVRLTSPAGDSDLVPVAVPLPVTADMLSYQSMVLVALVVIIGAAGGIGGGGVLVPVLMISESIGPHGAIPMSKLTIFGSAVCQLAINARKRHTLDPRRPLIDYHTTLMLEPPTLLGTVYGVTLNRMTPRWIIATLLMLFLAITAFRTSVKGMALFKEESELSPRGRANKDRPADSAPLDESAEDATVPWKIIVQLGLVWCLVLGSAMLRRTTVAGCGTLLYWVVIVALTACIAVLSHVTGLNLVSRKYTYMRGDVRWNSENIIQLPIACVFAGVLAGMLGVGGGMVMQPLMLELGLLPDVCAATAAFMMLFTSSSTTLQFTLNGMLDWERNIALPAIGVVGAALGSCVIGRMVNYYSRKSLIILPVAVIMGISFFLMGYTTLADLRLHGAGSFHGPCNDINEAYNVSSPKPGRFNATRVLNPYVDAELFQTTPVWQIVFAGGLVASAFLVCFCRFISSKCERLPHHNGVRGESVLSTNSVEVENDDTDASDSSELPLVPVARP